MPEISRFYGIVIRMYFNDHAPSHFHAEYGEDEMLVRIDTLEVYAGALPARANGMVMEWAAAHQSELQAVWNLARAHQPLTRIAPLP